MPARTDSAIKTDAIVFMTITPYRESDRDGPLPPASLSDGFAAFATLEWGKALARPNGGAGCASQKDQPGGETPEVPTI